MWVVEEDMAQQITLTKQTAIVYLLSNADLIEHTETFQMIEHVSIGDSFPFNVNHRSIIATIED